MLSSCTGGRSNGPEKSRGSKRLSSNGFKQHHHQSRLELLASSSSDNLDNAGATSGNSTDHSCRSLFANATKPALTDANNNLVPSNGFINADGSIFALAGANQARVIERQPSLNSNNIMLDEVSSSSSPALSRGKKCQQSAQQPQQQRRIQYQPIHQKLQRIYGNKLQEFEHQRQSQLHNRQHQPMLEPQGQESAHMSQSKPKQAQPASQQRREHANQQHFHPAPPAMYSLCQQHEHQERTYDSLSPPTQLSHMAQQRKQHQHQHQQLVHHNHHHLDGRQDICAIPEEECDHNNNEILLQEEHAEDQLIELEDEEGLSDQEEAEEEQRIRAIERHSSKVVPTNKQTLVSAPSVLVDNRKKQLESLHYAAATAAALLNVTASAAAAFAVSEKHLNPHLNQADQRKQHLAPTSHSQQAPPKLKSKQQIYSEAYQDINHNQRAQRQYQAVLHYGKPAVEHPVRAAALKPTNLSQSGPSRSFRDQHLRLRQQQQIYNQHNLAHMRARNQPTNEISPRQTQVSRPMQMHPLTTQQVEMLRQQRQLQLQHKSREHIKPANFMVGANQQLVPPALALPLGANGPAALAVLHQQDKLELEMISRLVSLQQKRNKQRAQVQYAANLGPSFLATQHALAQVSSNKLQGTGQMHALRNHDNKPQVTYGLLVAHKDKQAQHQQQQIYGGLIGQGVGPLLQKQPNVAHLASGASSEASAHTNLPLILDRQLRPVGFVEKICQIDLTAFWWTLLVICAVFIAAVVTISRYVF